MGEFNGRFGEPTAEAGSAFVACTGVGPADTLCAQKNRQVERDNCVAWRSRSLQIPQQAHLHHCLRNTVRVHEQSDCGLATFGGPRCLARFDADGQPVTQIIQEAP